MNKIVLGLLGAFALASVTAPAVAAPAVAAPVAAAVFYPEASGAAVQTVQYRPHFRRHGPFRRFGYQRHYVPYRYAGRHVPGVYRGPPRY